MLIGDHRPGEASRAAAGMLAPSVEQSEGPAHDFAVAARDFYPDYLEDLADETGIRVPLNRLGILQVALTEKGVKGLQKTASSSSRWPRASQPPLFADSPWSSDVKPSQNAHRAAPGAAPWPRNA